MLGKYVKRYSKGGIEKIGRSRKRKDLNDNNNKCE
jgi:hypothetical protein